MLLLQKIIEEMSPLNQTRCAQGWAAAVLEHDDAVQLARGGLRQHLRDGVKQSHTFTRELCSWTHVSLAEI